MSRTKNVKSMIATVLFCSLAATASASVPDAPEFGPIGGAAGQVLRINVVAIDPLQPVLLRMFFQDILGRRVGPEPRDIALNFGDVDDVELNFSLVSKGRMYVRPVVQYAEGSGRAIFTTELYDDVLGRTVAGNYVGDRLGLSGSVHFGPIGLAHGAAGAGRDHRP